MNAPPDLILPVLLEDTDKESELKNRIRKNYRHLRKWAKRSQTDCFRLYERDIKAYPVIIDFYAGRFCVHYLTFDWETEEPPADLKEEVDLTLMSLFGVSSDHIYDRMRIRRRRLEQYEKQGETQAFFTVYEYGVKFQINLIDYLDTGLFLDHRETRQLVARLSPGKHVLNLFAYTCSFSVHAAYHGALSTKSVDLSQTYTKWGAENFLLNGLSLQQHSIVRADCLKFLEEESFTGHTYDIIVIDPPTISRSKKMDQMFDVQRDYLVLITQALKLLAPKGILFFSTNLRSFIFDISQFPEHRIQDISEQTIPLDFRNHKIHRCWRLQHLNA